MKSVLNGSVVKRRRRLCVFVCVSAIVLIYGSSLVARRRVASSNPLRLCWNPMPINMFSFVPQPIRRYCSIRIRCFQIKSVIFLLCLNICLKFSLIAAGPTSQQQQELLLLEALSKRQPSYYGTSNSIMDILGRSMYQFVRGWDGVCVCASVGLRNLFSATDNCFLIAYARKHMLRASAAARDANAKKCDKFRLQTGVWVMSLSSIALELHKNENRSASRMSDSQRNAILNG